MPGLESVVNVTSVRHRSPFRYPGGKTWLVPRIRQWLASLSCRPREFIEPFAGGAIIGLTVAAENLVDHVTLVELDDRVAAVWRTIIEGDAAWLAARIGAFEVTPKSVEDALSQTDVPLREKAFQTILLNRINRGGILAPGAGRLNYGENGRGIRSRWYPQTLQKRILDIVKFRGRITFIEGDGLQVLTQNAQRRDTAFLIDPPYTAGGKSSGSRLYRFSELDHESLFEITSTLSGDFLMTYASDPKVRRLARRHGFETRLVAMKGTHHRKMMELLVGRDLSWAR